MPIAAYAAGPFALTRALATAVNVVPMLAGYARHLFGHTHRPDARAWPSDVRQDLPPPQLAADDSAASRGLAGARSWLRTGICPDELQADRPAEASEGGALLGPGLIPASIDPRRFVPWRNAAIVARPHRPTCRGFSVDSSRTGRQRSEVLFDSGRDRALGSNPTAVYPELLAAARRHAWTARLASQAAGYLPAVIAGKLPAGLVVGEAALSRSLGGAVSHLHPYAHGGACWPGGQAPGLNASHRGRLAASM